MKAEHPVETVEKFVDIWVKDSTDFDRLIPELISVSNETNRKPDAACYIENNGQLLDPNSGKPLLDFIAPGVEYDIAQNLQTWSASNTKGMAIWISPKLEGVYPCNKALVYQIDSTSNIDKKIQYSAIVFDGDIENPEKYRESLLTFEDDEENLLSTLSWIEEISGQPIDDQHSEEHILTARYFAEKIKSGVDRSLVVKEMHQSGFLGNNPVSCPPGKSGLVKFSLKNGKIMILSGEKVLCCQCPFCKREVMATISSGKITCPNCAASAPWGKAA